MNTATPLAAPAATSQDAFRDIVTEPAVLRALIHNAELLRDFFIEVASYGEADDYLMAVGRATTAQNKIARYREQLERLNSSRACVQS